MFEQRDHETSFQHVLRTIARAWAVVCLATIVLFLIGVDLVFAYMSAIEWIGFLFFPTGVFAGLVLSWRRELIGGTITIASIVGFYLVYGLLLNLSVEQGWALLLFLIPGLLFVTYGVSDLCRLHAPAR